MGSKNARKKRECSKKQSFSDSQKAWNFAYSLRRKDHDTMDAYLCPFCKQWHVGHRNWKTRQSLSARRRRDG